MKNERGYQVRVEFLRNVGRYDTHRPKEGKEKQPCENARLRTFSKGFPLVRGNKVIRKLGVLFFGDVAVASRAVGQKARVRATLAPELRL